jgi:hypothetical protein
MNDILTLLVLSMLCPSARSGEVEQGCELGWIDSRRLPPDESRTVAAQDQYRNKEILIPDF